MCSRTNGTLGKIPVIYIFLGSRKNNVMSGAHLQKELGAGTLLALQQGKIDVTACAQSFAHAQQHVAAVRHRLCDKKRARGECHNLTKSSNVDRVP